ncbi:MAG: enoyl-CoA hydratase/isomerase family protein [Smithella sp.]
MDIVVKYCGGCNCQIDRSKIIKDIASFLGPDDHLSTDNSFAPFAAGILACGCRSACAWKPETAALAKRWVILAGKSVDSRDLPEEKLTAAVSQKILKIKDGGKNMDLKYLLLSVDEKVAMVTINRPDKGNALAPYVLDEIAAVFTAIAGRHDINVVVFTGGEKYFSAGFDLNEIRQLEKVSNEAYIDLFHRAYRAILFCPQPVICAVGGAAIAGGFDLTMMCDIRYASERAKFGQREIVLSLTPIMDPLWRIIGLGRAKEVALTGRIYDAYEAEKMGYISKIFPEGKLLESVGAIAREMASYDHVCLKETKQITHKLLNSDLDGAMKIQEWLFRSYIGSEDNHQRIDALQAKLAAARKK